jgi:integrator complex subunit 1
MTLNQAVRQLKALLGGEVNAHSTEEASQLFLASIHLLCALKKSQHHLRRVWYDCMILWIPLHIRSRANLFLCATNDSQDNQECDFPSSDQIPAIAVVLHEADLFRGLVRCLHANTQSSDSSNTTMSESSSNTGMLNGQTSLGRKRANSVADKFPNKSLKTLHSPVPTSRVTNLQEISRNHNNGNSGRKPTFNNPVLASTILFSAFEYVDHWPVQFVKAYAEDCFGPRVWVDHPHCSLFVANLELIHTSETEPLSNVELTLSDAARVVEAYRGIDVFVQGTVDEESDARPQLERSSSNSSRMSANGPIEPHPTAHLVGSREATRTHQLPDLNADRDDGSSSGEEDNDFDKRKKRKRPRENDAQRANTDEPLSQMSSIANFVSSESIQARYNGSTEGYKRLYPLEQKTIRPQRVRCRFHGENRHSGHEAITMSLADRLRTRSKQNSSLLQCLPAFTSIPGVRSLIASNLEKWLQSPALAGLARALFASTVNQMKIVDPPLREDLDAIDSLIGMHLKANQVCRSSNQCTPHHQSVRPNNICRIPVHQLNAHLDNITSIAMRMPFISVANQMYSKLLRELIDQANVSVGPNTDQVKMIGAIHRVVPPQVSYEALAEALLMLLVKQKTIKSETKGAAQSDRHRLVRSLRSTLRALALHLGSFDGVLLVESLLSFDVSSQSWSVNDEEDKARLMLQCATLSVSPLERQSHLSERDLKSIKVALHACRKLLLTWGCTEYCPHFRPKGQLELSGHFDSALVPRAEEKTPRWLSAIRCILFLEDNEANIKSFILPGSITADDEADWDEEMQRIRLCCKHGGDLDDNLVWIVVKSTAISQGLNSTMAILLLEHLFEKCSRMRQGLLSVSDPHLVWELYNVVQFSHDDLFESLRTSDSALVQVDSVERSELPR